MTTKEKEIQKLKDIIQDCEQKIKELENSYELEVLNIDTLRSGYILCGVGDVKKPTLVYDEYIIKNYQQGNWFATREEAELERDRRELLAKFRQFRDKCNDGWEPDWSDYKSLKYNLICEDNNIHAISCCATNEFNLLGYFKNLTDCEKALELFGEEIMRLYVNV